MNFFFKILSVPVIMGCATVGTIGMLKLIKKTNKADENGNFKETSFEKKINEIKIKK